MGRTLGPYTDVSTARVDGAYEIYEGTDDEGRKIEILTLGVSSSKDPSRRALLSDTVAWAHATRGPADAPILKADLNDEQPYVVTLRQTGYRGVERMLERMLAMGPATGPLPLTTGATTGQIPRVTHQHSNPHGIPAVPGGLPVGSPVTPNSPMTPYLTAAKRTRPGWLIPVVIMLSLVVLGGGTFVVYLGLNSDTDVAAGEAQPQQQEPQPDSEDGSALGLPRYQGDLPPFSPFGPEFADGEGLLIQPPGWPFAFRVADGWDCQLGVGDRVVTMVTCKGGQGSNDAVRDALHLELIPCPADCGSQERELLEQDWTGEPFDRIDDDTAIFEKQVADDYELSLSRFFTPQQNVDFNPPQVQLVVRGMGSSGDSTELRQILNDILMQTQALPVD